MSSNSLVCASLSAATGQGPAAGEVWSAAEQVPALEKLIVSTTGSPGVCFIGADTAHGY